MKKAKDFRMAAIACALLIVMCIGFAVSYGLMGNSFPGTGYAEQAVEDVLLQAEETDMSAYLPETAPEAGRTVSGISR